MPTNQGKRYENRIIVLPFDEAEYPKLIENPIIFREKLGVLLATHPKLFPAGIENGFLMKDIYRAKQLDLAIRRIEVGGTAYTIRPSFVLPHQVGRTAEAEHALFLRKFNVPFWALAIVFGYSAMHWWRLEQSLGRHSIVETTVQHPDNLPPPFGFAQGTASGGGRKALLAQ